VLLVPGTAWAVADMAVQVSLDVVVPAAGQMVEFTVTVTNLGPDEASDVALSDRLPDGLAIPAGLAAFPSTGTYNAASGVWSVGSLQSGASASLVIPVIVTAGTQPPCLANVASVTRPYDSAVLNNRAVAAVKRDPAVHCSDVGIWSQSASTSGSDGAYTFTDAISIFNYGPDDATSLYLDLQQSAAVVPNLHFVDSACNGLRCTFDVLTAGHFEVVTAQSDVFKITSSIAVTLVATVSGSETDYATDNNMDRLNTTVSPPPNSPGVSVDEGWGGVIAGGGCFIATAAYGSPLEPHVMALRRFRDRYLTHSAAGRALIRLYYRYSPPMAAVIARHDWLRLVVRAALTPLVMAVAFPGRTLVLMTLLIVGGAGWLRQAGRRDQNVIR